MRWSSITKENDMKRYAAFLRGINLNGKNQIAMADLKSIFLDLGYAAVSTVLNSGNVLFSAESRDIREISGRITDKIREAYGYDVPVCIVDQEHLKQILDHAPAWWNTEDKARYHNLIFVLTEETPAEICLLLGEPSEGKEKAEIFNDVIFWSYDLSCYQKCSWWKKTASKGIAEKLTIRTGNTVKKMCR